MTRKAAEPHYIRPESITDGDTVRVTWTTGAIEHARVARVAFNDWVDGTRAFYAEDGVMIFQYIPGAKRKVRVTLLDRPAEDTSVPLFEVA